ncbi:MAG: FtsQ-type POTRA domain-containing protein [Chloroflexi bacterium]|nr:FtsQ-type POTRA domain-containing protein [Chloroflexota bacterium]
MPKPADRPDPTSRRSRRSKPQPAADAIDSSSDTTSTDAQVDDTALEAGSTAARPRISRKPRPHLATQGRRLPAGAGPGARIRTAPRLTADGASELVIPRRWPRGLVVLLGLVIVVLTAGLGGYAVLAAGFFRVDRIEVSGATLVATEDIARATGALNKDLFQVDAGAVRQRVERISGVRQASVRKVWPRRVEVIIQEREPVAVWQVGGVGYAVDADGIVLEFQPDYTMLTIIQTDGARGLAAGDRVDSDAVTLATRLRDMVPLLIGQQVQRFEWTQGTGLRLTIDRGPRVLFGDGVGVDYKVQVWRGVMEQARRSKVEVREVDLRSPDRPFYR